MPLSYPQNVAKMDLLEYLPQYRIVLCKLCKSAIHPSALSKHCQNSHARRHSTLSRKSDNETIAKETLPALLEQSLLDPRKDSVPLPQTEAHSGMPTHHMRMFISLPRCPSRFSNIGTCTSTRSSSRISWAQAFTSDVAALILSASSILRSIALFCVRSESADFEVLAR